MSSPLSETGESRYFAELRAKKDLTALRNDPNSPIMFAEPIDNDYLHLEVAIIGPKSTPYENGIFLFNVKLSEQFPFKPPQSIIFKHPVMHPNVTEWGTFITQYLTPQYWTPATTIKDLLEIVWICLAFPDVDTDQCDIVRAHSYKDDPEQFDIVAREYAIRYALATSSI